MKYIRIIPIKYLLNFEIPRKNRRTEQFRLVKLIDFTDMPKFH